MLHLILTPFAMGTPYYSTPPTEEWISHRMRTFRKYTCPSVASQTCQDFTWVLTLSPTIRQETIDELKEIVPDNAVIIPWDLTLEQLANKIYCEQKESTGLITTRLDNDDALNIGLIEKIKTCVQHMTDMKMLISYPLGLRLNLDNDMFEEVVFPVGPFCSLVERPIKHMSFDTTYKYANSHARLYSEYKSVTFQTKHMYILTANTGVDSNVSNTCSPLGFNLPADYLYRTFGTSRPPSRITDRTSYQEWYDINPTDIKVTVDYNRILWLLPFVHGDVLEIGCHRGYVTAIIRGLNTVQSIDAIDITDKYIEAAQDNLSTTQSTIPVNLSKAYIEDFDNGGRLYDTILLLEVLEHVLSSSLVLEKCLRLLKPGGRLLISVPENGAFPEEDHLREYTASILFNEILDMAKGIGVNVVTELVSTHSLWCKIDKYSWILGIVRRE